MTDILKFKNLNTIPTDAPQDPGFDTFLNYVCTIDPTDSEPDLPYLGYPWLPLWWQTATSTDGFETFTTQNYWLCVDNTADAMVWWRMVFDANILSVINSQGWKINTNRNYTPQSSPAFNTAYSPSSTNDFTIVASISLSSTLLTTATVEIQVNTGSGFSTIAQASLSGIDATFTQVVNFSVPAGASYKLVQSSGTSSSIVSIEQLTS